MAIRRNRRQMHAAPRRDGSIGKGKPIHPFGNFRPSPGTIQALRRLEGSSCTVSDLWNPPPGSVFHKIAMELARHDLAWVGDSTVFITEKGLECLAFYASKGW